MSCLTLDILVNDKIAYSMDDGQVEQMIMDWLEENCPENLPLDDDHLEVVPTDGLF